MTYRHILIIGLFFASTIMPVASRGESDPLPDLAPSVTVVDQSETKQANAVAQASDPPVFHVDFSETNLTTPESAAVSFVQFYNGILPVSTVANVVEICEKFAAESYQKGCLDMLNSRLSHIKSIAINLEGAMFKTRPVTKLSTDPMQIKTSWQENLTFFDGSSKVSDKNMIFTLKKLKKNDWKIYKIKQLNTERTSDNSSVKSKTK